MKESLWFIFLCVITSKLRYPTWIQGENHLHQCDTHTHHCFRRHCALPDFLGWTWCAIWQNKVSLANGCSETTWCDPENDCSQTVFLVINGWTTGNLTATVSKIRTITICVEARTEWRRTKIGFDAQSTIDVQKKSVYSLCTSTYPIGMSQGLDLYLDRKPNRIKRCRWDGILNDWQKINVWRMLHPATYCTGCRVGPFLLDSRKGYTRRDAGKRKDGGHCCLNFGHLGDELSGRGKICKSGLVEGESACVTSSSRFDELWLKWLEVMFRAVDGSQWNILNRSVNGHAIQHLVGCLFRGALDFAYSTNHCRCNVHQIKAYPHNTILHTFHRSCGNFHSIQMKCACMSLRDSNTQGVCVNLEYTHRGAFIFRYVLRMWKTTTLTPLESLDEFGVFVRCCSVLNHLNFVSNSSKYEACWFFPFLGFQRLKRHCRLRNYVQNL